MFIKLGERRINVSLVKEYRPFYKSTQRESYFSIQLIFLNDTVEEIHFFKNQKERDDFLVELDKKMG
jgi:hypothetical protein